MSEGGVAVGGVAAEGHGSGGQGSGGGLFRCGSELVSLGVLGGSWPYVCGDVVELGDEGVLDDVDGHLRGDHHDDVGTQNPQVLWRQKINSSFILTQLLND